MFAIPIKARTISPFYYHHIAVTGGSATIPEAISDRPICFGLCAALGMMSNQLLLANKVERSVTSGKGKNKTEEIVIDVEPVKPNYRIHMESMPWFSSMLVTDTPRILPPLAVRSDLGVEGGYPDKVKRAAASGNFKEYFKIQEVPNAQVFTGALFIKSKDYNPFEIVGSNNILIRIGARRAGALLIEVDERVKTVQLNTATASMFGSRVPCEKYLLNDMQMSADMDLQQACEEVSKWK